MGEFVRSPEPADADERGIVLGWLAFHRDALQVKCQGVPDEQLVERAAAPSKLSLLGLVRHMAEMEHVYGNWSLGPKTPLAWVWGSYDDDAEPDFDCTVADVDASLRAWREQMARTDEAIAAHPGLDERGEGNGRSVRWNLAKLVGEYARHNGHADIIRERIDGQTGE
ncbi:MAG TPA: DinB family protein [Micromonosporaceae bacterium]|jgi:hypothetical protein